MTLYSVGMVGMSVNFSWPLPVTLFMLIGVPLVLLLYTTRLAVGRLLAAVGVMTALFAIIDVIGHASGSWYTIVGSSWRPLGMSMEMVLFAVLHLLFLLTLYEYAFDDGRVGGRLRSHALPLVSAVVVLLVAAFYLFSVWLITFPFAWIIVLLCTVLFGVLLISRQGSTAKLLKKAAVFSVLVFPLSLLYEYVALVAEVRVFAFVDEYLFMVPFGTYLMPVEEVLLLLLWPALMVVVYECFVDDGR